MEFTDKSVQEARDRGINPDNFDSQDQLDEAIQLHHEEYGETPAIIERRRVEEEETAIEDRLAAEAD